MLKKSSSNLLPTQNSFARSPVTMKPRISCKNPQSQTMKPPSESKQEEITFSTFQNKNLEYSRT